MKKLWLILTGLAIVLADQASKYAIIHFFDKPEPPPPVDVIPHVLRFTFTTNTGGAFGWFKDGTPWLIGITATILLVGVVMLVLGKIKPGLLTWSVTMVIAGGLGNLIDRMVHDGHVIDFIDVHIIWNYNFNIADSAVVVGVSLIILHLLLDLKGEAKSRPAAETASDHEH